MAQNLNILNMFIPVYGTCTGKREEIPDEIWWRLDNARNDYRRFFPACLIIAAIVSIRGSV
jgi:hypothetical protein